MRLTDKDCYTAMIRLARAHNDLCNHQTDLVGVSIPTHAKCSGMLEDIADRLDVPIRRWGDHECGDGPRLILDHAPSCYGGGVRPALCMAGETGEFTPEWWAPSAGLGPGAVPRKEFCQILAAAQRAFEMAYRMVRR